MNGFAAANVEVWLRVVLPGRNTTLILQETQYPVEQWCYLRNYSDAEIVIGGVVKYQGDVDGLKTGQSLADNTTGFTFRVRAFGTLPVNFTSFLLVRLV